MTRRWFMLMMAAISYGFVGYNIVTEQWKIATTQSLFCIIWLLCALCCKEKLAEGSTKS